MRVMSLSLLLLCGCTLAVAQQTLSPVISNEPISAERIALYRDFLTSYSNGSSATVLNISDRTDPFRPEDDDRTGCLKHFNAADLDTKVIHRFSADSFPSRKYRIVDPETHKKSDPGDAIRRGEAVDNAVEAGFAAGILTFSEVIFDPSHTHAAFSFSFVCGGLCGHGWTVLYQKQNHTWRQMKANCSHWIG
jgi:hypothetical protein